MLSLILVISCQDDDDANLPAVNANFVVESNPENTGVVGFLNLSTNATSYAWNFGDENTSTLANPVHTYAATETPRTTYTVTLIATNLAGISNTFEDEIEIFIPLPMDLPVNFDNPDVLYDINTFNGANATVVANPNPSGSNETASNVLQITNSGVAFEGISFIPGEPINLETEKTIQLDLWSETAADILVKLENSPTDFTEISVNHTGSGWERMKFDLESDATFTTFVLFIDGPGTTAGDFYVDNISQIPTVDETAPVITLIGDNPLELTVGNTYTDPGATAEDNVDGNISANIVVGGDTVDTNVEGSYTVTYNVSDEAGNAATEVTRVVNVNPPPTTPLTAAPAPTQAAENVISIYSDQYTDVPNDGFNLYGGAGFEIFDINGDGTLRYTAADNAFQVIELGGSNQINLTQEGMTHFHFDLWFPTIDSGDAFLLKVVDLPGDTAAEALITIDEADTPPLAQGQWLQYDFTLEELEELGLTSVENIQQVVIDLMNTGEVFVDNIYFYNNGTDMSGSTPSTAAPAPTQAAENVISIYSDQYTDVSNDGFNLYGGASFEIFDINGDGTLRYTTADNAFQVIELGGSNQINLTQEGMTHFHFDLWFPTIDSGNAFLLKVVDLPGDTPAEALITIDEADTPPLAQGQWLQYDFTLGELEELGLTSVENIQQIVIDLMNTGEVFVDNVYFYREGSSNSNPLVGSWSIKNEDGSGVGPAANDPSWWHIDATVREERACFIDDVYVFGSNGSFSIMFGDDTYLEGWQSGTDNACGAPVAPHDNSNSATYTFNEETGELVLNGVGAFIGLAKVLNNGELTNNNDAPQSRTYTVTFEDENNIVVVIENASNDPSAFWTYRMGRN